MTDRRKLLARLSASQFAAWEVRVYLDTHPCDRVAADLLARYTKETAALKAEYERQYGPLTVANPEEADWQRDPWPWDYQGSDD